jgi:glucosamine--fructose-6-phosphate aminotransferase (isomerizing)
VQNMPTITIDGLPEGHPLLAGAIALQLLTLELAHVNGTNPDLIRREQEAYREAAKFRG